MSHKIVMGSDLYKGWKLPKNTSVGGPLTTIDDILPFQMLSLDDKTPDWIHAVADYYEAASWTNVEKKAGKIQKNFWMRQGKLDTSDYIINPEVNPFHQVVGMITPSETQSPLEQFYSLAPNFVDVLRGEFTKRDHSYTVVATDPYSKGQSFGKKNEMFQQVLMQMAAVQKQQAMAQMGITQDTDPKQYEQQLQQLQKQMTEVEFASKNFRTEGEKWAEKVVKIHENRYNLDELEPDGFESGLICDKEFWHLDLLDDDFTLELLNPKWCDYHKGPNTKYVSNGDYFAWFDFMSSGDIINKYGRRMKEEDILKMKDVHVKTQNIIVPDYQKSGRGTDPYYNFNKPWSQATDLNPAMNDAMLGKELAYNYMRSSNFEHNQDVDLLNPVWGNFKTGHPQMFRLMNLYWRSMRRFGWLTKINKDGSRDEAKWIDENYRVTLEPKYDKSVVDEETKNNLLVGEHIDWTWGPEWRRVIKISANEKHTFWLDNTNNLESIYLDGGPVKFQFKGVDNPFDSLPPVEGCEFSYFNAGPHSFIDRIKPLQIIYNICMNKIPKNFLNDFGLKVAIHNGMMMNSNSGRTIDSLDPREAYEDKLRDSNILDYRMDAEMMRGQMGQPPIPSVLNLSTVEIAQFYFNLGREIKWEAGELVGITRQRAGGAKASDTATSIEQGVSFSETQTEKYFEQHTNLMKRVRQRMLDATQYYSTFNESNRDIYMTDEDEKVFLEITGMENTLPQYNINLQSKAGTRAALQRIQGFLEKNNTMKLPASAYIEGITENSLPKLRSLIKEAEGQQNQMQEAERNHELQLEQERQKSLDMQHQFKLEEIDASKKADYQRETHVAEIRALGGMQTDVNANNTPDAQDNMKYIIQQQQMEKASGDARYATNLKRVTESETLQVEREKAAMKLQGEKYKSDKALEIAEKNKNKYDGTKK